MKSIDRNIVMDLLQRTKSILNGHFELSSGYHSSQYFQCARVLQYPEYSEMVSCQLATLFDQPIDTVVGPALGGIIIGYEVARALKKKSLFVERKDNELCLRRGFEINKGEKIIIIEDVITTAKSALEATKVVEDLGGEVVGYGCIVDRSQGKTGLKIKSIIHMDPEIYTPEECPMCKEGSKSRKTRKQKINHLYNRAVFYIPGHGVEKALCSIIFFL